MSGVSRRERVHLLGALTGNQIHVPLLHLWLQCLRLHMSEELYSIRPVADGRFGANISYLEGYTSRSNPSLTRIVNLDEGILLLRCLALGVYAPLPPA